VRLASADIASGMAGLESVWNKISPSREFEYTFLDASLAAQYKSEARSKTIVKIASLLSVFIACMGLFGLATLHVARKTAEIGIRKVMGAEVWNIVRMITADFIILSLVAILIAFPLAWWAMRLWLQDFAYSISMSWWVFALAGLFTVAITIFSVSFQAIKAALADPVKSLRSE
jgi:putative ABC transport system permease protein